MTSARREQVVKSLQDKEYRDAFVSSYISLGLAFQVRAMREAPERGWTQAELAQRAGMKQSRISQIETSDYDRETLTTLKRLASALDVALIVRFAPYSELVDWTEELSPERLAVPSFNDDQGLVVSTAAEPGSLDDEEIGTGQFLTRSHTPKASSSGTVAMPRSGA